MTLEGCATTLHWASRDPVPMVLAAKWTTYWVSLSFLSLGGAARRLRVEHDPTGEPAARVRGGFHSPGSPVALGHGSPEGDLAPKLMGLAKW
jgi:hypothetical protein